MNFRCIEQRCDASAAEAALYEQSDVGFFAVKSSTLKGIRDLYLMVFRGKVSMSRKAGPLDASSENQRQDETESMSDQNGRHLFRSLSRQCYF